MNVQTLAAEAYGAMERRQRGDETITTLKDDAPEWVRDLVYAAHDGSLPNDWRYAAIRSALEAIADCENGADLDDRRHEWADAEVDTYTGARLKWLASDLNRADYCDQAAEELGCTGEGIVAMIGAGQYIEACEVWDRVTEALRERAEELEDEPK